MTRRCEWATKSEREQLYHDTIWGVPVHNDKQLFKMLLLEGQQAGLSWSTILNKMDTLCDAYDNFDPSFLRNYDDAKIAELLQNSGVIRNKLKVKAAIKNSDTYFAICEEFGTFDTYIWQFSDGKIIKNNWENQSQIPAHSTLSDAMCKDLKRRGFSFVGGTITYAFMQSIGMVNDHMTWCDFRDASERGSAA